VTARPTGAEVRGPSTTTLALETARRATATSCLALAALALATLDQLRRWEAALGAVVVGWVLGEGVERPSSSLLSYPVDSGRFRSLDITWQASSAVVVVPILVVVALACLHPAARPGALALRATVGVVLIVTSNQLRFVVIALATARWGDDGFQVAQQLVGSGLVLLAFGVAVAGVLRARRVPTVQGASRPH
jgi:exosortase/archaeosortase family protein